MFYVLKKNRLPLLPTCELPVASIPTGRVQRIDRQPGLQSKIRSAPRIRHVRCAFTIVELAVVMLILGLVAAVAAPTFFRSLQYHQVESAARRIKMDLEQLRHMAKVKSRDQTITFTDESYTLSGDVVDLDHSGATYSVDFAVAPFELADVTIDFGGPTTVTFDGYGNPSVGGTVVLTKGDEARTVTLDATTGQVTISSN